MTDTVRAAIVILVIIAIVVIGFFWANKDNNK